MCGGGNSDDDARSKAIERELRKDFANYKRELKLLLLGTGESGKSTIIKQMRIIYGDGFSDAERQSFKVLVFRNCLRSIKALIDALDTLGIALQNPALQDPAYDLLDIPENEFNDIAAHKDTIAKLWKDEGIQKAFQRRNEFQLSDSTQYFLDDLSKRIALPGYVPDLQDVLRAREATTGIHEFTFVLENAVFRMLDVGGQRSERRKWIHCFESITSIIFIVASSEYDQKLAEADDTNRMVESIALFDQVINYEWFRETSFILFLNKQDVLEKKVKTSHLKDHFPGYTGPNFNYEKAKEFILSMYMAKRPPTHDIYPHFTMATDTENITFVFKSVRSTILRLHLKDYNLY